MRRTYRRLFWSLWPLCFCLALAVLGPKLAPKDPLAQNLDQIFCAPGSQFWLGTDLYGRDLLSRLLAAAPRTLLPCFVIVALSLLFGLSIGLLAAHYGRIWAGICRYASHAVLSVPELVFILAFAAFLGPDLKVLCLALCLVSWPKYAWQSRKLYQQLQDEDWLLASEMLGTGTLRLVRTALLPALGRELACMASLDFGAKLMELAGLAFLGVAGASGGLDWASILREGRGYAQRAPWLIWGPLLCIFTCLLLCNLAAESWNFRGQGSRGGGPLLRELRD